MLRVFKLAKSWRQLRNLIDTITRSLKDISSFSVLMLLLIFIYVLIGMESFSLADDPNLAAIWLPQINFSSFWSGVVCVFIIFTGDNWDDTMFRFAHVFGYSAIGYFLSLVLLGQMIFLNLFVAILLDNFEMEGDPEDPNAVPITKQIMGALESGWSWFHKRVIEGRFR